MGTRKGRPRPPSEETLQLEHDVLTLRRSGVGIVKAAEQLGVPRSTAASALKRALSRTMQVPAAELRDLESDRLDHLQLGLWAKALRGDTQAVDRILRIMERRARLLGLDHADGLAERALQLEAEKVRLVALAFGRALDAVELSDEQRQTMTAVLLRELRAADGGDGEPA